MIVAWQFIARDLFGKVSSSRRDGSIEPTIVRLTPRRSPNARIIPSLRDGAVWGDFPGNKLPGYDQLLPSGQDRATPNGPFNARYQIELHSILEDEGSLPDVAFRSIGPPLLFASEVGTTSTRTISVARPKPLVTMAVREEFVPREKSATVLVFSAYV
jgi:hypothetical protein